MKYTAALSVLALAASAVANPTEGKAGYEIKGRKDYKGYKDYDYGYKGIKGHHKGGYYDGYHGHKGGYYGGHHGYKKGHWDNDYYRHGYKHGFGKFGGRKEVNVCSAKGHQQVCCSGGILNCAVQALGSKCKNEAYCCETGKSLGGLINISTLNCAKLL